MKALCKRPMSVAKLVALGNTNKQIAAALFISAKTVEKHRQDANHFFNVDSAIGIARALLRSNQLTMAEFVSSTVGDNMRHHPGGVVEAEAQKHAAAVDGMKFFEA